MNMPHRYQYGSLTRRERIRTEDVWEYRYYEITPEGQRRRRTKIIGTLGQYPTQGDALLRLDRFRSLLHLVFQHGRRWEITDVNPIDLVRQRAGRRSIPRVLSVREIRLVLDELIEPYRTMVLVAACLGLRAIEIVGLQWGDLNGADLTLLVRRSVVHGRVGETKTEASRLPLPVDPRLADAFREHLGRGLHRGLSDFVFANRKGKPRWQESILHRQIKPAVLRAGVGKIGWHTFRHSYSSLLRRVGADIKV